jgi:hypothetical protein
VAAPVVVRAESLPAWAHFEALDLIAPAEAEVDFAVSVLEVVETER